MIKLEFGAPLWAMALVFELVKFPRDETVGFQGPPPPLYKNLLDFPQVLVEAHGINFLLLQHIL